MEGDFERAFQICPECGGKGTAPLCGVGAKGRFCPRLGTVDVFSDGGLLLCEAHVKENRLASEIEDLEESELYLDLWLKMAKLAGRSSLEEVVSFAIADVGVRLAERKQQMGEVQLELGETARV